MSDSNEKQVWFMRHGRPDFDYHNCSYDEFLSMLTNGHNTPLVKEPNIDFESLPSHADLVCYSPALRAVQTVKHLERRINVRWKMRTELLEEVKFDKKIISKEEFVSLKQNRSDILIRWYNGLNKAEFFEQSMQRVKQIESFLLKTERSEQRIVFVTHGWFLRLLHIYFVQDKKEGITLNDLLGAPCIGLGKAIHTKIAPKVLFYANTTHSTQRGTRKRVAVAS